MRRTDLGAWGADLPPEEFGRALAAALVLSAMRPRAWRSRKPEIYARRLLARMQDPGTPSKAVPALLDPSLVRDWPAAGILAAAWPQASSQLDYEHRLLRLELEGWQDHDPTWAMKALFRVYYEGRVFGAFLHQSAPGATRTWHLPLRVGFLPDPDSRQLRDRMSRRRYEWLSTLVELRPGFEACDLLLLPHSLPEAVARVMELRFRPDASCVLVLGHEGGPFAAAWPLLLALQSQASSSALGLLGLPRDSNVEWFGDLTMELSHDQPLDVALLMSCRRFRRRGPIPLLVADSGFVAVARASYAAEQVLDRLVGRAPAGEEVELPDGLRYPLNTDSEGLTVRGMLSPPYFGRFRDRVHEALRKREFVFGSESGDASYFAELGHAVDRLAAPPPEESRRAQVRVQELDDEKDPRPEARALVAGRDYAFDVRVAPLDPQWPSVSADFPDKEIDFSRGPVDLTVVFSGPDLCPEPLVEHIMLPPAGASTECRFVARVPSGLEAFQARIAFVYRNRVLQTVLVSGQVVASAEDLAEAQGAAIERAVETTVGPGFDYLLGRRHFDAALVLNHTAAGRPLAMALKDDRASWVSTEKFQQTEKHIRKMLTDMSQAILDDETLYATLDAPETNDLLLNLAMNGAELYFGLIGDRGLDFLKDAKRIQIVATDFDRFFPLEFVYDREVPDDDAKLCLSEPKDLEQALHKGSCEKACPERMSKVICPLGFWCLRCVIERHTYDPKVVPQEPGDYALIPEGPTQGRAPLRPLHSAVFGASQRVDKKVQGQRDEVMATLKQLVASKTGRAETWTEWEKRVKDVDPSLLLLIPHTVFQHRGGRQWVAMEIGKQAKLLALRIKKKHVRPRDSSPPPVVLLLGCETGADELKFDSLVAGFRRARAALVVTTLSTVLGRHAAPIAQALLRELSGFDEPKPFGEAALAVRQKLFAEGMPAVLTLAVYGDADWLVQA
jgi:hypothetical protein